MFFVFLLSGLFLGWSLGANDAANVYGTAVGTRMLSFRTAAVTCSIFVVLGAVFAGAGASHTLGKLGAVDALPGSFTVALAAAITVTWMTRLKLPVSTSQAVVGAIIGWNAFSGSVTDWGSLTKIVGSWIVCPILASIFAVLMLLLARVLLRVRPVRMLRLDGMTRVGLFVVGAFASYSLGANNIANVVGVFVPAAPFAELDLFDLLRLSGPQQLFLIGGIAIGVGVFTYSKKVMLTVGNDLFRMSPLGALIVVLAQAIVLFLFASEGLENWLAARGLPTIPLVPVSSSQAVIGAVLGVGLAQGGRNIRFGVLGRIASGWVSTPILAAAMAFVLLFIVKNVFSQEVNAPVRYLIAPAVAARMQDEGLWDPGLERLVDVPFDRATRFEAAVEAAAEESRPPLVKVCALAQVQVTTVDIERLRKYWDDGWLSEEQLLAVFRLHGQTFRYRWQLDEALARLTPEWRLRESTKRNKLYNKGLQARLDYLHEAFAVPLPDLNGGGR